MAFKACQPWPPELYSAKSWIPGPHFLFSSPLEDLQAVWKWKTVFYRFLQQQTATIETIAGFSKVCPERWWNGFNAAQFSSAWTSICNGKKSSKGFRTNFPQSESFFKSFYWVSGAHVHMHDHACLQARRLHIRTRLQVWRQWHATSRQTLCFLTPHHLKPRYGMP